MAGARRHVGGDCLCLALALSVLHSTTLEQPDSLAAMLETLADPGGERNPLMPGNTARYDRLFRKYVDSDRAGGISMPRALDDGTMFESIPEQDAIFAVAAVVSRDGRIANYELLNSERSGQRPQGDARQRRRDARRRCRAAVAVRAGADAGRPRRGRQHGVGDCDDDGADA